ncbi:MULTISPECIES: hypothetical protein [unclassified Pedobacter]|uniref:hypothetical protein n=1 Tax=unclassified Pedobacter TaxID=2628915 RepID=UPI0014216C17|nr:MULTISPECIES: hypothetical protein [unclassified Pedobacter]NII81741.1 hypothetical protein [Pedobacter sp. SG908]NMN35744.1 hypothetical protein [Pedobacter sp. SG918]
MAVQVNLVDETVNIDNSKDSIVIIENQFSIPGGKSLDTTGYTLDVINAGHIIIKETATGNYKPMPLTTGNTVYDALPAGHTYVGVNVATILTKRPFAGVMIEGYVNENASPFSVVSIKAAFMTATLNEIKFRGDLS